MASVCHLLLFLSQRNPHISIPAQINSLKNINPPIKNKHIKSITNSILPKSQTHRCSDPLQILSFLTFSRKVKNLHLNSNVNFTFKYSDQNCPSFSNFTSSVSNITVPPTLPVNHLSDILNHPHSYYHCLKCSRCNATPTITRKISQPGNYICINVQSLHTSPPAQIHHHNSNSYYQLFAYFSSVTTKGKTRWYPTIITPTNQYPIYLKQKPIAPHISHIQTLIYRKIEQHNHNKPPYPPPTTHPNIHNILAPTKLHTTTAHNAQQPDNDALSQCYDNSDKSHPLYVTLNPPLLQYAPPPEYTYSKYIPTKKSLAILQQQYHSGIHVFPELGENPEYIQVLRHIKDWKHPTTLLWTDGCALSNPGPCGSGLFIQSSIDWWNNKSHSIPLEYKSNSFVAEIEA